MLKRSKINPAEVTQELLKNLRGRDVWLDITAKDGADRTYDIEVQRSDKGAGFRRARYHSSMIDSNSLNPGDEFDDLPENYVIFLTENDVIGDNEPIYVIERTIQSSGKVFDDGSHIIYVNGARKDAETELGRLVHDFFCTNPNDMHYEELANVTRYFKETEEGVGRMCKVIEEMRDETARNKAKEIALNMIQGGELSLETISKYSGIPLSEVQELANGVVA